MSSSKGDPSNKMPWMKKMMGQLNYESGLLEKARREDEKKEGKGKKKKLTETQVSAKV